MTAVLLTIAFTVGILFSAYLDIGVAIMFSLSVVLACILVSLVKRRINFLLLLVAIMMLLGSVRYADANDNPALRTFYGKYPTITGYINSLPSNASGSYKYRYTLRLETIEYDETTYSVNQDILLNTNSQLSFGDVISARGKLLDIQDKQNEYAFDQSGYYKSKGIFIRLLADEVILTGEKSSFSPVFLAGKLKSHLASLSDGYFAEDTSAVVRAITLGDKTGFSKDYRTLLVQAGLSHTLYAPFIHISVMLFLVSIPRFSKKETREFLMLLFLILYGIFNSTMPTALKAAGVMGIILFRRNLSGLSNKRDALCLSVFAMTFFSPNLWHNAGFCMSVISTIFIITSYKPISDHIFRWFRRRNIYAPRLTQTICLLAVFVIGTLPFSAFFYNGTSCYSIILSTLLLPLIAVMLILSPFMYISLAIFGKSFVLGRIVGMGASFIKSLPLYISKLPFYYISLKTPSILTIVCFCILWWIVIRILKGKLKSISTRVLAVILLGFTISGILGYNYNTLYINFVNVGHGDGAVIRTSRGETVLIDGGGSAEYQNEHNTGKEVYLPYLVSHGITNVDVAILSHYHKDHAEGIIAVMETLPVDTLVMPDCAKDNEYRIALEALAEKNGTKIEFLSKTDEIRFASGLTFTCLAPDENLLKSHDLNETSLVFSVTYGDFVGIFGGDSYDVLSDGYPKDVDLLKVSHHGSPTSSGEEFIKHISPRYAVISLDANNPYGHPKGEVTLRLLESGAEILRTDRMGDIRFCINKNGEIKYTSLYPSYTH